MMSQQIKNTERTKESAYMEKEGLLRRKIV
jgi:hypothetical protein